MRAFVFGTFNPVTNAHVEMGITAKRVFGEECEVVFVPTPDEYIRNKKHYKEGSVLNADTRVMLLKGAVEPLGFTVSTIEIDGLVSGKTFDSLEYLNDGNGILCVGMDNLPKMRRWYRRDDLLSKYFLLVFRRGYYNMPEEARELLGMAPRYGIANLSDKYVEISSTQVREHYINNNMEALNGLVPENVLRYLKENKNVFF